LAQEASLPRFHARWPDLQGPAGALTQTLVHGWVCGALILPNGGVLSWSRDDGTLRVWDLATGEGRSLTGHAGSVIGAVLLPDGRVLSWSNDKTLRVWDLATGEGRSLTGHGDRVTGALILPDGRVLSWSNDRTVRLQTLDETAAAVAFHFDARPTAVLLTGPEQVWVGDALGGVHVLELLNAPS
jgi:WD40 repeat protein